jgi:hypothetical protein
MHKTNAHIFFYYGKLQTIHHVYTTIQTLSFIAVDYADISYIKHNTKILQYKL